MFMYAWSASSSVHWIVQATAITVCTVHFMYDDVSYFVLIFRLAVYMGIICDIPQCGFVPC